MRQTLPAQKKLEGAVVRLVLEYPQEWEAAIDDAALREYTAGCSNFTWSSVRRSLGRIRIPEDQAIGSLTPGVLKIYWRANHTASDDAEGLQKLAQELITQAQTLD